MKALSRKGVQVHRQYVLPYAPTSDDTENCQLRRTASILLPPFLAKMGLSYNGQTYAERGIVGLRYTIEASDPKGILFASSDRVFVEHVPRDPYFRRVEQLGVPSIIYRAINPINRNYISRKDIPSFSGFLNDQRMKLSS